MPPTYEGLPASLKERVDREAEALRVQYPRLTIERARAHVMRRWRVVRRNVGGGTGTGH